MMYRGRGLNATIVPTVTAITEKLAAKDYGSRNVWDCEQLPFQNRRRARQLVATVGKTAVGVK